MNLIRQILIYLVVSQLLIILAYLPFIVQYFKTTNDRVFLMPDNEFTHDYFGLVGTITLGKNGYNLRRQFYSTEEAKPGYNHVFYIHIGKLAQIFNLSPFSAYHISRMILAELFVGLLFLLSFIVLGERHALWGALICLTISYAPLFLMVEKVDFANYPFGIPWWVNIDTLGRLTHQPHYLLGDSAIIGFVILIHNIIAKNKIKLSIAGMIVISFIGGIYFPPSLIFFVICPVLTLVVMGIKKILFKKNTADGKIIYLVLIVNVVIAISILIFFKLQQEGGFSWNLLNDWEFRRWNYNEPYFNRNLIFLFGLTLYLAIPAIYKNIIRGRLADFFLTVWAMLPFVLLPFVNVIGVPKIRLLTSASYIPLGLLAFKTLNLWGKHQLLVLLMVINLSSSMQILTLRLAALDYYSVGYQFHLPRKLFESFIFIEKNIAKNSIFLSSQFTGNLIPAFAPMISFIGHPVDTLNITDKQKAVELFYQGSISEKKAYEFLQTNKIDYVYLGELEKQWVGKSFAYSFLNLLYSKDDVFIYQVKK